MKRVKEVLSKLRKKKKGETQEREKENYLDMEKRIAALSEQNVKISKALINISVAITKFDESIRMMYKKMAVNSFLIDNILHDKFNLSWAEIKELIEEAEEKYKKAG